MEIRAAYRARRARTRWSTFTRLARWIARLSGPSRQEFSNNQHPYETHRKLVFFFLLTILDPREYRFLARRHAEIFVLHRLRNCALQILSLFFSYLSLFTNYCFLLSFLDPPGGMSKQRNSFTLYNRTWHVRRDLNPRPFQHRLRLTIL